MKKHSEGNMNEKYRREMPMNKEFERCCRQIAKMMEKYSPMILQDINKEIKYRPELLAVNADSKKSRFTVYVKCILHYQCRAA